MTKSIIAAVASDGAIGKDNRRDSKPLHDAGHACGTRDHDFFGAGGIFHSSVCR